MHYFGTYCNRLFRFGSFPYGGLIMGILGIIVIGFIVFLIMKNRNGSVANDFESPLDLLQKRFIKGEIDKEEYLEKKKILS